MNYLEFKREAREMSKRLEIGRARAHERLAKRIGFNSHNHLLSCLDVDAALRQWEFGWKEEETKHKFR